MVETIQRKLNDSPVARWTALGLVAFMMLCGYFITDMLSPMFSLLQKSPELGGLGWSGDDFGSFMSAYGWLNVFLLMLIFGGIILDKMGVRFTGLMSALIMLGGVAIKLYGVSHDFGGATVTIFGTVWGMPLLISAIGYAIFAMGVEIAGITVSKIIVKWFKGKELALAMGLEMACARLGMGIAMFGAPYLAILFPVNPITTIVLSGVLLMVIGVLAFLVFMVMDRKLDRQLDAEENVEPEEPFRVKDIFAIVRNKGFWLIAILCLLFYSAVFPFMKYATNLMENKFGVETSLAGWIVTMLPFGTILLTPLFGTLYDRIGKGATLMLLGSILLFVVHVLFAIPALNSWIIAVILMLLLGIAFSLVPSAMWPSVPKIIPENQLGTAYALIFWLQNWGLMGVPLLIGKVLDKYCIIEKSAEGCTYNYTLPMMIFAGFALAAIFFALWLKAEDRKKKYGLEMPNIKK